MRTSNNCVYLFEDTVGILFNEHITSQLLLYEFKMSDRKQTHDYNKYRFAYSQGERQSAFFLPMRAGKQTAAVHYRLDYLYYNIVLRFSILY